MQQKHLPQNRTTQIISAQSGVQVGVEADPEDLIPPGISVVIVFCCSLGHVGIYDKPGGCCGCQPCKVHCSGHVQKEMVPNSNLLQH